MKKHLLSSLGEKWKSLESKDEKIKTVWDLCLTLHSRHTNTQLFIFATVWAGTVLQTILLFGCEASFPQQISVLRVLVNLTVMHLWSSLRIKTHPLSSPYFIRSHTSAIRHNIKYVTEDTIAHEYVNWERASEWIRKFHLPLLSGTPGSLRSSFRSPGLGLITALISKLPRVASHPATTADGTQRRQTGWPGREQIKWDLIDGSLTS